MKSDKLWQELSLSFYIEEFLAMWGVEREQRYIQAGDRWFRPKREEGSGGGVDPPRNKKRSRDIPLSVDEHRAADSSLSAHIDTPSVLPNCCYDNANPSLHPPS